MLKTKEDLFSELQRMHQQNLTLLQTIQMLSSELEAANMHCMMAQNEISALRTQLDGQKKKRGGKSTKLRARFVTLPELQSDFERHEAEQQRKAQVEADKQAQKQAANQARLAQIEKDVATKTFNGSLKSYKKPELVALAGALSLSRDGTVDELRDRITRHLGDSMNEHLRTNPRFSGLFESGRCSRSTGTAALHNSMTSAGPSNTITPPVNAQIPDFEVGLYQPQYLSIGHAATPSRTSLAHVPNGLSQQPYTELMDNVNYTYPSYNLLSPHTAGQGTPNPSHTGYPLQDGFSLYSTNFTQGSHINHTQ